MESVVDSDEDDDEDDEVIRLGPFRARVARNDGWGLIKALGCLLYSVRGN